MQHQMQVKFWIRSVLQRTHTRFSLKALKVCFYRIFWPVFIFFIFANLKPVFLIKAIRLDSEQHKAFITAGLDQSERLNLLLTFFFFFPRPPAVFLFSAEMQTCAKVWKPWEEVRSGCPPVILSGWDTLGTFPAHLAQSCTWPAAALSRRPLCIAAYLSMLHSLVYRGLEVP